jgi:hypothetical protein
VRALERLLEERENLGRVAGRATAAALAALVALDPAISAAGPLAPYVAQLDVALRRARRVPMHLRAEALLARGKARVVCAMPGGEADLAKAARLTRDPVLVGRCTMELGVAAMRAGKLARAFAHYHAARASFAEAGAARPEAEALAQMGLVLYRQGCLDDARASYERAIALSEGRDLAIAATLRVRLGAVHHERGELARARADYRRALVLARRARWRRHEAVALAALGLLAWEMHDTNAARVLHERAILAARALGDRAYEGICLASLGALEATCGRFLRGERRLERARALVAAGGDLHLSRAIGLYAAIADGARARKDPDRAAALRARAEHALVEADDGVGEDVRFARRMLRVELGGEALTVHASGAWFRAPGAHRKVSLGVGPSRILATLAERHQISPGAPVGTFDLVTAGWPDEAVAPLAGANRVYVAIASLRKLGLERFLVRTKDGYALDPGARVEVVR